MDFARGGGSRHGQEKVQVTKGNIPSGAALGSPLVKFHFIHCPHCALDVLHTHETFVKGQVVADGILNGTIHKTVSTKQINNQNNKE